MLTYLFICQLCYEEEHLSHFIISFFILQVFVILLDTLKNKSTPILCLINIPQYLAIARYKIRIIMILLSLFLLPTVCQLYFYFYVAKTTHVYILFFNPNQGLVHCPQVDFRCWKLVNTLFILLWHQICFTPRTTSIYSVFTKCLWCVRYCFRHQKYNRIGK